MAKMSSEGHGLAIMFGGKGPDGPRGEHDEDEHDPDTDLDGMSPEEHDKAKDEAVEEIMASLQSRKADDLRRALEAFIDLHDAEKDDEDEHDEMEDDEKDEEEDDEDLHL